MNISGMQIHSCVSEEDKNAIAESLFQVSQCFEKA